MTLTTRTLAAAAVATALMLAGCATPPASTPSTHDAVLPPNANLLVQGIPPITQQLVDRVQAYTDFRGHSFVEWHPRQRQMLVAHRKAGDNLAQLYLLRGPLAEPEQLTSAAEPVTRATFEPTDGRYLVFERSSGGNEAAQLFRLDLKDGRPDGEPVLLTNPDERHNTVGWLKRSGQLLYTAVPLDRTAQGGTRAQVTTSYWVMDPTQPDGKRKLADLPGGGWFGGSVSPDDKQLAVIRYLSANESQVWLIDLANGERRQVLPAPGQTLKGSHFAGEFTPDGKGLYFFSDRAGEFREAMLLNLASGNVKRISSHVPWDVASGDVSGDGTAMALIFNVDGRDELRLFDGRTLQETPQPQLPPGSVNNSNFHPQRAELAVGLDSAQGPNQLYALDLASGQVQQWTRAQAPSGVDMASFNEQSIIRWPSFDGRSISGLLTLPPAKFTGKRPVIINIHGGPEGQAKLGFLGRNNYFLNELGIAFIQPNVRGSSGFGKTFLTLDNGMLREDSVKDIGALLDWVARQPNLDASRVLVTGGSYGGYMSLAVSTHYADRIAGAIDVVGISDFVTFLETTESYRRDLRRVEYGDERDPAMRAFQKQISPLTNAGKIRKPLLVVQGKNDPRVPYTEAEQIVAQARANGTTVWYLRAENEGHGFRRKENADYYFYSTVKFIEEVLAPK
jgi:dipeptidyl aminopeptidase/acylaminoacyl peptidase